MSIFALFLNFLHFIHNNRIIMRGPLFFVHPLYNIKGIYKKTGKLCEQEENSKIFVLTNFAFNSCSLTFIEKYSKRDYYGKPLLSLVIKCSHIR